MKYNVIPPLIHRESARLAKEYSSDNNIRNVIRLLANKMDVVLTEEEGKANIHTFILNNFVEVQIALGMYYRACTEAIMKKLEEDDIYKGVRIKYVGGSLLGSDVYKIIDKVGGK